MTAWWFYTIATLLAGPTLVVIGLRGRRLGEDPYCAKCGYCLRGTMSEHCSECGNKLTPGGIVHGLRVRRWPLLILGLLVCVVWITSSDVVRILRQVDWCRHSPTWFVIHKARDGGRYWIKELHSRVLEREFSTSQVSRIANLSLDKLVSWPTQPSANFWPEVLEELDTQGLLDEEQRDRYLGRYAQTRLTARSVIRQGDPFVMGIDHLSSRAGKWVFYASHDPVEVSVGGLSLHQGETDAWRYRKPDWICSNMSRVLYRTLSWSSGDVPVGTLQFDYLGRDMIFRAFKSASADWNLRTRMKWDESITEPDWSKTMHWAGEVTVEPSDAPDPVSWIDPPAEWLLVAESFDVCIGDVCWYTMDVSEETIDLGSPTFVQINKELASPFSVAFDVVFVAGNIELEVDSRVQEAWRRRPHAGLPAWAAGEIGDYNSIVEFPAVEENQLYVILRGSRDVARRTVDLYEIWNGELGFGPFRVQKEE